MNNNALPKLQALLLLFILISTMLPAQKIGPIWLDRDADVVEDRLHAEYYRLIIPKEKDSLILQEDYTLTGQILERGEYLLMGKAPDWKRFDFSFIWDSTIYRHGRFTTWDDQGGIRSFKDYHLGNQTTKVYHKHFFSPKASIEMYGIRNYELKNPCGIIRYKDPEENIHITLDLPRDHSDAKDSVWMSKNGSPFWLEKIIEFDESKAPGHFTMTGFHPNGQIAYKETWEPIEANYQLKYRFSYSEEENVPDTFYSIRAARIDSAWYYHQSGELKHVNFFQKEKSGNKKHNKKRAFTMPIPTKEESKYSAQKVLCRFMIDGQIHIISLSPGETIRSFFESSDGEKAQIKSITRLHHDWHLMSYQEYHVNGQLKTEGEMIWLKPGKNSQEPYNMFIKNGLWTHWDSLGQVTSEAVRVGKFQSLSHWRTYYPNGQKEEEKIWDVTELNGMARRSFNSDRSWYPNGKLKEEWSVSSNQKFYKKWTVEGTLITYYSYKDGRKHGPQYRYTSSGEVLASLIYENGKLVK